MRQASPGCSALILAVLIGVLPAQTAAPQSATIAGTWRGEARLAGEAFETFLEIAPGAGDQIWVHVTAPRKRVRRAVMGASTYRDRKLVLDLPALGAQYRGTLSPDGRRISGTIAETIPLDFARVGAIPPPHRPQEPRRPYPYRDEEVSFLNDQAGIRFFGTLTVPTGPGPHPAAVLITGAGAQDRDEAIGDYRPFLVIADQLTRRGIAVLRFDDRGVGKTRGSVLDATSEDLAMDALAAAAFLAGRRDIDSARIGLIGHSEGGMIAMIAASRSKDVRFVVSLAGVAVKCETLAYQSLAALATAYRISKPFALVGRFAMAGIIGVLKSPSTDAEVAARLRVFLPDEIVPLLACRWTRFIVRYDPTPAIEKVGCPVLGLYFSEDVQVPAKENAAALRAAADRSGNKDVTVVTIPRLNHIFQINVPTPADAARLDDTIAPEVLERMGAWILEKTRPAPVAADSRR